MDKTHSRGKILHGTEGMGTVMLQMIEKRARKIARCDGRKHPNGLDQIRAREELIGATPGSEKRPTRKEPRGDCEIPLVSTGEKASTVRPEDDENLSAKLNGRKG
jgi:hypothetical protein